MPSSRICRALLTAVGLALIGCSEIAAPRTRLSPGKTLHDDCNTMFQDCGDPIYAPPSPPDGVQVGYSWNSCVTPATDVDLDGVDDGCEWALAKAFAPLLKVSMGDCDWDGGLLRLGGEYYFGVQRNDELGPRIRIAYLPAYYKDCGGPDPHKGDSEFILEDVSYEENSAGGAWRLRNVFTSSHCGSDFFGFDSDPNCQWFDATSFNRVDDPTYGPPVVWVSYGKHSNYSSSVACNGGTWVDVCGGGYLGIRFPIVYSWQNIGSAKKPQPGLNVTPQWGSLYATAGTQESFWDFWLNFNGWNPREYTTDGATSYGQILAKYAHFWTPIVTPNPCEQNIYYQTC